MERTNQEPSLDREQRLILRSLIISFTQLGKPMNKTPPTGAVSDYASLFRRVNLSYRRAKRREKQKDGIAGQLDDSATHRLKKPRGKK